jgi:nitrate/TMAO reductase-like tetraheme cytochrome c subunit
MAKIMGKLRSALRKFFFPPHGSPRWVMILPYAVLGVLTLLLFVGGAYGWDYTNSSSFCGTTCHTMPPEYAAYETSPHAQVACVECHIGREFIGNQIFRKAGDLKHIVSMTFKTYEYPIFASNMRPARESCEKCHTPDKFSDDSLSVVTHYQNNTDNTPENIYLILKTGGGAKREGLGRGIHWHIVNRVLYYATDNAEQNIPYIRVYNDDGSTTEYVDVASNFNLSAINEKDLKAMDCITCHNRITHRIYTPTESMDSVLSRGIIEATIPEIHKKGVEVLSAPYTSQEEALAGIANLENFYQTSFPDYYNDHKDAVKSAVTAIQNIYTQSVFIDQKVDWNAHPNNVGHIDSPGCFRCHDGKHLNSKQEAIRLECNLCHSIPVVATSKDFVAKIEISRGPEPQSHLNPNWISLHHDAVDATCANCHTTGDAGGTSNTSFCSNSACHGSAFTYAGFDAPALRTILQAQLPPPTPAPTPAPVVGAPTFTANVQPIFDARCVVCHNAPTLTGGLDLSTFAGVMNGGKDGAVIASGDSAASLLVQIQTGKHFANLAPDELALIKAWIEAGAPER